MHHSSYRLGKSLMIRARSWSNNFSMKVVFKKMPAGVGAYWSFEENTLYLPRMDFNTLTEEDARRYNALMTHERKHSLLSSEETLKKIWKKDENGKTTLLVPNLAQFLFQLIEDCRIEMSPLYFLEGADGDLRWYRSEVHAKKYREDWDVSMASNQWGSIGVALQFALCRYADLPIPEDLKKYYDMGWEILNDGRFEASLVSGRKGCCTSLDLAQDIYNAWKIEAEENPKEDSGDGEDEKDDKDENSNIDNEFSSAQDMEDSGDGEDEKDEKDENSNIDNEFSSAQEMEDSVIDPDELNKTFSQEGEGETAKRNQKDSIDYSGDYVPYLSHDKTYIAESNSGKFFDTYGKISHHIHCIKNQLIRFINARQIEGFETGLVSGMDIDFNLIHKLVTNDDDSFKIFYEEDEIIAPETVWQIVVDLSGSMTSKDLHGFVRCELAMQLCVLFAETLNSLHIPFEIIGFNSSRPQNPREIEEMGCNRFDIVNEWFFKSFDESYPMVRTRLGTMALQTREKSYSSDFDPSVGAIGGCNIDHEVINKGAERLLRQPRERKIQVVLTDGIPSGYFRYGTILEEKLIETNQRIKMAGIEQFCFGIMHDSVSKYYDNYKVIHSLQNMLDDGISILTQYLECGQTKHC